MGTRLDIFLFASCCVVKVFQYAAIGIALGFVYGCHAILGPGAGLGVSERALCIVGPATCRCVILRSGMSTVSSRWQCFGVARGLAVAAAALGTLRQPLCAHRCGCIC